MVGWKKDIEQGLNSEEDAVEIFYHSDISSNSSKRLLSWNWWFKANKATFRLVTFIAICGFPFKHDPQRLFFIMLISSDLKTDNINILLKTESYRLEGFF